MTIYELLISGGICIFFIWMFYCLDKRDKEDKNDTGNSKEYIKGDT